MDEFHRPTVTFPGGAYNATQVRLYGIIPGYSGVGARGMPVSLEMDGKRITISPLDGHEDKDADQEETDDLIEAIDPSRIGSIGLPFPLEIAMMMPIFLKEFGSAFIGTSCTLIGSKEDVSMGIIFGYAYEGHCYDLPKPKVMMIPALPCDFPADDSGYAEKASEGYRLWIVDKLDECVEIEINQGFIEQIVLDANLPGRRSPSTYRATMALSHRGGKLTE